MSEVTLQIGGRAYKVACADGEEAQLARLGGMIEQKLKQMEGNLAPSEAQNLLFAALLLADELHEARAAMGDAGALPDDRLAELQDKAEAAAKAQRDTALELEALRAERDTLANDLANIRSATAGQQPLFETGEVTQKLDELASQLEKCADSLESRLAST